MRLWNSHLGSRPFLLLLFLFLVPYAQGESSPSVSERLTFAAKAVKVSGSKPIAPQILTEWKKLMPSARIDSKRERLAQLKEIARTELGLRPSSPLELERIPTRKIGGHEVYRITAPTQKAILKLFRGPEGFEETAREAAADDQLFRSDTILKGISILGLVRVTDGSSESPLVILSVAPGQSLGKIIESAVTGPTALALAQRAAKEVGKALSAFHRRWERAIALSDVPAEVRDYREEEHARKIRRWISLVDKPQTTLASLQARKWITIPEAASLRTKLVAAFEAYEKSPITRATVVHGDAHPKNFYFDAASGQVTAIDTAYMGWTLNAIGDPMEDLGRAIQGSVRAAVGAGLDPAQSKIEAAWLEGYFEKRPVEKAAITYYRLRFLQLILDADELTKDQARALLSPWL